MSSLTNLPKIYIIISETFRSPSLLKTFTTLAGLVGNGVFQRHEALAGIINVKTNTIVVSIIKENDGGGCTMGQ